jgi:hypothetical protein
MAEISDETKILAQNPGQQSDRKRLRARRTNCVTRAIKNKLINAFSAHGT